MSALHQTMCIFKVVLSSLYDGWEKYKEKIPEQPLSPSSAQYPNQSSLKKTTIYAPELVTLAVALH